VVLKIWGDKAKDDNAQWQGGPVLGFKKCMVSDFNGVGLSTLGSSQLIFEPQVRGGHSTAGMQPCETRTKCHFHSNLVGM
jgi:hypothetical protein